MDDARAAKSGLGRGKISCETRFVKALQQNQALQKLNAAVQRARLRLAKTEERVSAARQRRKLAKLAARRAKKRVRLAKEQVAEAEHALAEAEARLAKLSRAPAKIKSRKLMANKTPAAPRGKNPEPPAAAQPRGIAKISKPVSRRAQPKLKASSPGDDNKPPAPAPQELESPVSPIITAPKGKATSQIIKGVEEIFAAEMPEPTPVDPGVSASPMPPAKHLPTPDQIVTA
jgi:hypothetical protein